MIWSKCTKWGWKAKWIIPEHQGHSQFEVRDGGLPRLQMIAMWLLMQQKGWLKRKPWLQWCSKWDKLSSSATEKPQVDTYARRVIPGHLPEVDQSKWDGKLAKHVVDLGVDTWEEVCIPLNVLRLERKRCHFTSKPVHLGMMTDMQVWIVSCVFFWAGCTLVQL